MHTPYPLAIEALRDRVTPSTVSVNAFMSHPEKIILKIRKRDFGPNSPPTKIVLLTLVLVVGTQ